MAGSQQALRDFGVPARLATPLGVLLPLAELALACIVTTPQRTGAFVPDCPVLAASDVGLSIPASVVTQSPA